MVRGRGGSLTHPRVVELLQKAIIEKGQSTVEKETGLSHSMISRYKRGIGEPSQATLEKMSAYFGKPVAWLRGDAEQEWESVFDDDLLIDTAWIFDDISALIEMFKENNAAVKHLTKIKFFVDRIYLALLGSHEERRRIIKNTVGTALDEIQEIKKDIAKDIPTDHLREHTERLSEADLVDIASVIADKLTPKRD